MAYDKLMGMGICILLLALCTVSVADVGQDRTKTTPPVHQEGFVDESVATILSDVENSVDQFAKIQMPEVEPTDTVSTEEEWYKSVIKFRETQEQHKFWFVLLISLMTPVFLSLVLFFIRRSDDNSGTNIVNATGLILVIQATVLIVVTSTTSEQLTAAIGVIGAIAGYLFGSSKSKS